jgi:hypothetical protein
MQETGKTKEALHDGWHKKNTINIAPWLSSTTNGTSSNTAILLCDNKGK